MKKALLIILIALLIQIGVSAGYAIFGGYFLDPDKSSPAPIPKFPDNPELEQFIRKTYYEPYSLLTNNCIHKSLRIMNKAVELEMEVDLIACWTITPMTWLWGWPSIQPHLYTEIEGKRVSVALDPLRRGQMYDVDREIYIAPINLSALLDTFSSKSSRAIVRYV